MVTIRPLSRSLCRPLSRALVWLNDQARAYLLVDPAGADNSVLYMAKAAGAAGELVSVAYASPATQATTTVAVVGNAITVTPGTKARMVVSGTGDALVNGTYYYAGLYALRPHWTRDGVSFADATDGAAIYASFGTTNWVVRLVGNSEVYRSQAPFHGDGAPFPDTEIFASPTIGTGTPTVTAGVSSAAQVIAAVNASAPAAALVTASVSGASTGPVAEVAAAFLTLIPANALTLDGEVLTLDGQILTLD